MTLCNKNASLNLNKNTDDLEHQRTSRDLAQNQGNGKDPTEIISRDNEAVQAHHREQDQDFCMQ